MRPKISAIKEFLGKNVASSNMHELKLTKIDQIDQQKVFGHNHASAAFWPTICLQHKHVNIFETEPKKCYQELFSAIVSNCNYGKKNCKQWSEKIVIINTN